MFALVLLVWAAVVALCDGLALRSEALVLLAKSSGAAGSCAAGSASGSPNTNGNPDSTSSWFQVMECIAKPGFYILQAAKPSSFAFYWEVTSLPGNVTSVSTNQAQSASYFKCYSGTLFTVKNSTCPSCYSWKGVNLVGNIDASLITQCI